MPRKVSTGRVGGPIFGSLSTQSNTVSSVEPNANIIFEPDGTGIVQSNTDIQTNAEAGIRFADGDSSNYVLIKAPTTVASNVTLTLPANDGDTNQVLTTDGSGVLTFASSSLVVTNRTAADAGPYYITMSDQTTGTETTLSVADGTRFFYTPNAKSSTGKLTVGNIDITASTASSSTTSGALVVTGGVGVGGQLTAVDIVETSSIAIKENIEPIQNGLESILALQGVTYDRKDNNEHESGLIAEWTEEILPELVTRDENNNVVGIKYTKLTAYLIEAVKSLKQEIDGLKNK